MPTKKNPTNSDLLNAISGFSADLATIRTEAEIRHEENGKRLQGIETQVKYTNGQVRELKQWKSNMEAIELYKSKQPNVTVKTTNNGTQWDWKAVLAGLGVLATSIALAAAQLGTR